jgi:ferrous iron transport protein A
MTRYLDDVETGERFQILEVPDGTVRAQLLRIGFLDGVVECRNRIRNGPVVLEADGTQIALGASVAAQIRIDAV